MTKTVKRETTRFPDSTQRYFLFYFFYQQYPKLRHCKHSERANYSKVCVLTTHTYANVQVVLENNRLFEHDLFVTRSDEQINGLFIKTKSYAMCVWICV